MALTERLTGVKRREDEITRFYLSRSEGKVGRVWPTRDLYIMAWYLRRVYYPYVAKTGHYPYVEASWNVTAHMQTSPFKSAGGRQFSRLLATEVCASAVVMMDTPCSEVVWSGTGYPLHSPVSPSLQLPCVTVCHHISTGVYRIAECWRRMFWRVSELNIVLFWKLLLVKRDGATVLHYRYKTLYLYLQIETLLSQLILYIYM